MIQKKYILYVVLPIIALAAFGGVMSVSAASTTSKVNHMGSLVNAIAQKFNLNAKDVQKVFDDQKSQMHVNMQQVFADRINKAVLDGKLTQDQATKILAKKAELEAFMISLQGKTKQEVGAAMKTEMESLKQWIADNNIPMGYLRFGGGFGNMHRGFNFKK